MMNNSITINNQSLPIKEYKGQRVVTFKDIDAVHGRPDGTAKRNFQTNRARFIEGTDFFMVCVDEIRTNKIMDISPKTHADIVLMTESGYLMLVKSFTDDLAWTVQRELVNNYFRIGEKPKAPAPEYRYFKKTYKGDPVITLLDFKYLTGIDVCTARGGMEKLLRARVDYVNLKQNDLFTFKAENPDVCKTLKSLVVIYQWGAERLAEFYKCSDRLKSVSITATAPALLKAVKCEQRIKFTAAEYITTLQVLNGMKLKEEKFMLQLGCTESEYHKGKIKALNRAMEMVASPLSLGFGSPWLGND